MGVLDVVDIEHHVVAHLQRQVELLQFLPRSRVRRLPGVERAHLVAEGRTVDLHEDQPQAMRHVLHQGGLAVAWRGDQHQQAHQVGALVLAHRPHLLGQIVADDTQVDVIDQLVANERGQRSRLELGQAQCLALAFDDLLAQRLVAPQPRQELLAMATQAAEEVVHRQRQAAFDDARMLAHQAVDLEAQVDLGDPSWHLLVQQRERHRLVQVGRQRLELGVAT